MEYSHLAPLSVSLSSPSTVQFMGMLNAKHLNEGQVNEILLRLDSKDIGFRDSIVFHPEPLFA